MVARKTEKDRAKAIRHILTILESWGLHTLGDFAALEKDAVVARLGLLAGELWERANGTSTRLLQLVTPPEVFLESMELENETETLEPLLFLLRRFLEQLSLRLSVNYRVAERLTLELTFTNKETYRHEFLIPAPTDDIDILFRMLHTHLETFKSDHPIIALTLQAEPANPTQQQFGLFDTTLRNPNQLYETLARLTALIGRDRVGTPVLEDGYSPDAFHLEPFTWKAQEHLIAAKARPSELIGPALRKFRPPLPASVLLTDSQPAYIASSLLSHSVKEPAGPYNSSGQWWDDNHWKRKEWDLELADGTICQCHEQSDGWQLDGIYD